MDTSAYCFDERGVCGGGNPINRTEGTRVPGASGASGVASNPYGRQAWTRPQSAGGRSGGGVGSKTARAASPRQRRSWGMGSAGVSSVPPGIVAAMLGGLSRTVRGTRGRRIGRAGRWRIGRRRWHLWSVLGVAALSAFVLVALFQMANLYAEGLGLAGPGVASPTADVAPADGSAGDGAEAASTPRDEWRGGSLPFLYQIDPQYRDAPYAGATVGEAGCGPTSLAMVYVALTGKTDKDPAVMAAFSEGEGYVEGGLTAWRLMTDGAADLGLSSREVPADAGRLKEELAQGHPVICSVRPGDFTDTGHFLVVAGVADNGELVIHDPNSPANSARTWDAERVLAQCANLWAFERG